MTTTIPWRGVGTSGCGRAERTRPRANEQALGLDNPSEKDYVEEEGSRDPVPFPAFSVEKCLSVTRNNLYFLFGDFTAFEFVPAGTKMSCFPFALIILEGSTASQFSALPSVCISKSAGIFLTMIARSLIRLFLRNSKL